MQVKSTHTATPQFQEEKLTLQSFLKDSYTSAKDQITHSISAFREELTGFYNKAGNCISDMTSPVNNFLKDFTQIDTELNYELSKVNVQDDHSPFSNFVPIEQALHSPMEENY